MDQVEVETDMGSVSVFRENSLHVKTVAENEIPKFRVTRGWENEYDYDNTILISEAQRHSAFTQLGNLYFTIIVNGEEGKWKTSLYVSSPDCLGKDKLNAALDYVGMTPEALTECANSEEKMALVIECLVLAGRSIQLATVSSVDANASVRVAKLESANVMKNLDVYLDRPINQVGTSGWDFLYGKL